jgi:hypothetical protein
MVAKRAQERPDWSDVLKILSDPGVELAVDRDPVIAGAVASVVAKRQEEEKRTLELARKAKDSEAALLRYRHSCEELLRRLQPAIEQFNREFQFGKISARKDAGATYFCLPTGNAVEVSFFAPRLTGIKIRNGIVNGGGWIGLRTGRSANLVLLKEGNDDLYGRWIVCEVKLMALADPRKIIGRFGITAQTVQPFGFKDSYYYDQIQYAQGVLHAFTYTLIDNVEEYFATLIADACK